MQIAWVINNINATNGMVHVVIGLSNYFVQKGHGVEITSFYSSETRPFFEIDPAVKVNNLGKDWTISRIEKHNLLRAVLRDCSADIFLTCNEWAGSCAVLNRKYLKGKLVITQHLTCDVFTARRRFLNVVLNRFADLHAVLTESDKVFYQKFGARNVFVVPNANFPEIKSVSQKKKVILGVGSVEPRKGFDLLIEAFSLIAKEFPDWKLRILGEGPQKEPLLQRAKDLGLSKQIEMPGATKQIGEEYAYACIYALSSRGEGFPLTLVEAMASRNAVVAFEIPCVKDMLPPDSCIAVPCEDVQAFGAALRKMIADEEFRTRCSEAAFLVSQKYSVENVGNMWLGLFQELLG